MALNGKPKLDPDLDMRWFMVALFTGLIAVVAWAILL